MYSSEEFQKLWFLYKMEGEPQKMSIEQFCIQQGIPYQTFNKWFRTKKKEDVVPVKVVGRDEEQPSKPEVKHQVKAQPTNPDSPEVTFVKLTFGNGLCVTRNNLAYRELKLMVEKLEGLC